MPVEIIRVAILVIVVILVINNAICFTLLWEITLFLLVVSSIIPRGFLILIFVPSIRPFGVALLLHGCWQESFHHFLVSFVFFNLFLMLSVRDFLLQRFSMLLDMLWFWLWLVLILNV